MSNNTKNTLLVVLGVLLAGAGVIGTVLFVLQNLKVVAFTLLIVYLWWEFMRYTVNKIDNEI